MKKIERYSIMVMMRSLIALSLLVPVLACDISLKPNEATSPPNILFLLSDDQRFDELGATGNSVVRTPNLDRLAAEGISFSNAFVTTSVCSTSRASILTGQHMARHGIRDFKTPLTTTALDKTYPVLLRQAGYRTGFIGKFAVGKPDNENRELALPAGRFDYWFGFPQNFSYKQEVNGESIHLTKLLANKAIEFLKDNPVNQPFYLSVNFMSPHGPYDYFDPHIPDLYANVEFPLPTNLSREIYESHPEFLKNSLNGSPDSVDQERIRENMHRVYRLITGMDIAVGRIIDALEDLGLRDDTVIVFSSDNGALRGNHALKGKWIPYEESIRVPLLIKDPRIPPNLQGSVRDEMVLNIDLAPTLLGIGGVTVPASMQGRDIRALLTDQSVPWRNEWYYEHTFTSPPRYVIAKSEAVRTDQWKYIRYGEVDPPYEQLFDLHNDSAENNNLAKSDQHSKLVKQMRDRLKRLRAAAR